MAIQQTLKTEDYGTMTASKLDSTGVDFIYSSLETGEGKFGEFYVVIGQKDGEEFNLMFSSARLAKLIRANEKLLQGKKIRISKRGEGMGTNYDVRVLE